MQEPDSRPTNTPTPHPDPHLWRAIGVTVLIATMLPATLGLILALQPAPQRSQWAEWEDALGLPTRSFLVGERVYQNACALCHARDGAGLPALGKPLRNSGFVQSHTDEELYHLIAIGRLPSDPANTTGALMPARGGNMSLSDDALRSVVAFLRTMQDPDAPVSPVDAWVVERSPEDMSAPMAGMGGVGHDTFINFCSACHGTRAQGMEGLGLPLADSPFVAAKTDEQLIAFIKTGRPVWDAENKTGLDMPPKGGNPALSDEQIAEIVRYLRAIHPSGNSQ